MSEEVIEANTEETTDQIAERLLDEAGIHDGPSPSEEGTKEETKETSEDTTSKKSEEATEEEIEVPKEFHKHPAWQRIMKERDEAKAKLAETSTPEDMAKKLEDFEKVTTSSDYIKMSMKKDGYTEEAIESKLKELGHEVPVKPDDNVVMAAKEFGLTAEQLDNPVDIAKLYEGSTLRQYLADQIKIAQPIIREEIAKALGKEVTPIKERIEKEERVAQVEKDYAGMEALVTEEGILDWTTDIEPALDKFLTDNPQAGMKETAEYFKDLNHKLTIERFKKGGKQAQRDKVKSGVRTLNKGSRTGDSGLPAKTGDVSNDADALLDHLGFNN